MLIEIILIIFGFLILIKGADYLVKAASSIAKKFGLSEMLIGLTIVAIGTSLPEIFVTVKSALDGHFDLIISNAIGSSICNFLLVIGVTSLVKPINLDKRIINRHLPIGLGAMGLVLFFCNTRMLGTFQVITRGEGLFLIMCTIAYVIYTIYEEKTLKNKKIHNEIVADVKEKEKYKTLAIIFYLVIGILGLKFGADFVVDNAMKVATYFKLSEKFVGISIVAIGTALPEIITGIIAAKKNETDLLLGNISGSNIINLCLLIGLGAVISPLTFISNYNYSLIILILLTIFLQAFVTIGKKSQLDKKKGVFLIILYIIYLCINI